jgi:hypothetical protein
MDERFNMGPDVLLSHALMLCVTMLFFQCVCRSNQYVHLKLHIAILQSQPKPEAAGP